MQFGRFLLLSSLGYAVTNLYARSLESHIARLSEPWLLILMPHREKELQHLDVFLLLKFFTDLLTPANKIYRMMRHIFFPDATL